MKCQVMNATGHYGSWDFETIPRVGEFISVDDINLSVRDVEHFISTNPATGIKNHVVITVSQVVRR